MAKKQRRKSGYNRGSNINWSQILGGQQQVIKPAEAFEKATEVLLMTYFRSSAETAEERLAEAVMMRDQIINTAYMRPSWDYDDETQASQKLGFNMNGQNQG